MAEILWDSCRDPLRQPSICVYETCSPSGSKLRWLPNIILGPYHSCGRREYYGYWFIDHSTPSSWHGNYMAWQCVSCKRRQAARSREQLADKRRAARTRYLRLAHTLRMVVRQFELGVQIRLL